MRILIFVSILLSTSLLHAQEGMERNAVSVELGKTGFIKSFTFDHRISTRPFGLRALIGGNYGTNNGVFVIGGGLYTLIGAGNRHLELGADVAYLNVWVDEFAEQPIRLVYPDYDVSTFYPSVNIGYRSYGKKTLFRFGFSPGYIYEDLVPGGYVSFGITF